MVNSSEAHLDDVFRALADPTRRAIVARLAEGDATVGDLADPLPISSPAVTKHLKVLERAGLLHRSVEGRVHRCRLEGEALRDAARWMSRYRRFWEGQLDSLEVYLGKNREGDGDA